MSLTFHHATTQALDPASAVAELRESLPDEGELTLVFCSPDYPLDELGPLLATLPGVVVGCTSAGQIGAAGFQAGGLTAATMKGEEICARAFLIRDLDDPSDEITAAAAVARGEASHLPSEQSLFGLLLVDGLAKREEVLTAALFGSLGEIPIVGGSAGDDLAFRETHVLHDGVFHSRAAVFTLVRTSYPTRFLKFQHHVASEQRLVVTDAQPQERRLISLNGRPAAEEYARALGVAVDSLGPEVFSAHPFLLQVGGQDYLRSISGVTADGALRLFSAIERGVVIRIAESQSPIARLEAELQALSTELGEVAGMIACDCILRRLEFERLGLSNEASALMSSMSPIGFHTYGEQVDGVHVNQTLVAVALGNR